MRTRSSVAGAAGFREVRSSTFLGQSYVAWDGLSAAIAGFTFDPAGNPSVSTQIIASTPAFPVGCVTSGDFDGDGVWDLLLAGASGAVAEMEQVAQHLPFERRQVAGFGRRFIGLVDRLLDLVAKGRFMIVAEDQRAHPAPQSRALFWGAGHQSITA